VFYVYVLIIGNRLGALHWLHKKFGGANQTAQLDKQFCHCASKSFEADLLRSLSESG